MDSKSSLRFRQYIWRAVWNLWKSLRGTRGSKENPVGAKGRHPLATGFPELLYEYAETPSHLCQNWATAQFIDARPQELSGSLFSYVSIEERIPANHPPRRIRKLADQAIDRLNPSFCRLYALEGRPSVPPEQLLLASLLQAFYGIRSERRRLEQLHSIRGSESVNHCCSTWIRGITSKGIGARPALPDGL